MLALLLVLQGAAPADSLPRITLAEALQRAARLDPNYVAALGLVDNAVWARRSAFSVFILPSVTVGANAQRVNPVGFSPVPLQTVVTTQLTARYDLFTGGQKLAELSRSGAALEGAHAGELSARFATALLTEADYYAVLSSSELARVARERVRRAEQQLGVSRARVDLLARESNLRLSRLELGRRVGAEGPVDAVPLDTARAPELPLTLADAIAQAAEQGPQYRVARANERAAAATFRARLGDYLPHAALIANALAFDNRFFPSAVN